MKLPVTFIIFQVISIQKTIKHRSGIIRIKERSIHMKKKYYHHFPFLIIGLILSVLIASCKKDPQSQTIQAKPIATLGLYELDTAIYRRVFIAVTQVGTQTLTGVYPVFDTGSTGLSIDASGILPASMITNSGIQVPGDSVVVNGITVTNQTGVIAFGNAQSQLQESGNLAYATVTIGDQGSSVTTTRIPFFLYYKVMDITTGQKLSAHSNDVFGVGPGVSFANSAIGSPLSYFTPKNGGISGFKLSTLSLAGFSNKGRYVANLLTVGLVPSDISSSSGFVMHTLRYFTQGGYSPDIASTVSYNGNNIAATVLFDTGTPAINIIENSQAPTNTSSLPANTSVTITTNNGFTYQYTTTSTYNLTDVARPSFTGDLRTIFGIDFFISNEFLMDYDHHQIGLKNN